MENALPALRLLVDGLERFEPLTVDAREAIFQTDCVIRSYAAGRYVLRENDRADFIGVAVDGFAYSHKQTNSGSRQILSVIMPGSTLVPENIFLSRLDCSVQTLTAFEVGLIPRKALRDLTMSFPEIATSFGTMLALDAAIFKEWMLNIGRRDARERVGHLLCEMAVRLSKSRSPTDLSFNLLMTQEQIGDSVGLTAAHVNRAMKALYSEGYLIKEKTLLKFPQWEKLCVMTEFNPEYLSYS
ncbi:Crp/Fnr family transcriptional regulator [Sphingomonas sp. Leaf30]|uniref:Crp/Fnr family transcriptional regulator n=1 Tax=Sphingomonas sp. Leaf30 TaxID=1736213 RepID=UPI000A6A5091|nr:Crp/Fnr family transcriptional regulator [Sphingomonas sp. Leaf30]